MQIHMAWRHDRSGNQFDDRNQEGEQQGKTSLFYVQDHLGSVTDVTDARGRLIGKLNYSAYGEQTKVAGQLPDRRYAGMFYDKSTNLYLTHYRFYDADAGRWLNRDPIGEKGGLNLYGYVDGNPVALIDPEGEAGRGHGERGASGGRAGQHSDNPYKHCKDHPIKPNFLSCKDHQTGKQYDVPKPAGWPGGTSSEMCKSRTSKLKGVLKGLGWIGIIAELLYPSDRRVCDPNPDRPICKIMGEY